MLEGLVKTFIVCSRFSNFLLFRSNKENEKILKPERLEISLGNFSFQKCEDVEKDLPVYYWVFEVVAHRENTGTGLVGNKESLKLNLLLCILEQLPWNLLYLFPPFSLLSRHYLSPLCLLRA